MLKPLLYLTSVASGVVGAWIIGNYGNRIRLVDEPDERSSHENPTPKGGGIGILAAFLFAAFIAKIPWLFWVPAGVLALFSFFGDMLDLSPIFRLAVQFGAGIVLIAGTGGFDLAHMNRLLLVMLLGVFVVGTTNIYNFMDGIDGIAAVTGIVGFALLALSNFLWGGETSYSVLSICMSMSCFGFLPYNIPKARVFMGDVGSVLLGFVFAAIVVLLSKSFLDFVCLASFLFPFYADELITMAIRIKDGENLLKPHRSHLYQLLANEQSIPHWKISIKYGILQLLVGLTVLLIKTHGVLVVLSFLFTYFAAFIFVSFSVRRKVAETGHQVS